MVEVGEVAGQVDLLSVAVTVRGLDGAGCHQPYRDRVLAESLFPADRAGARPCRLIVLDPESDLVRRGAPHLRVDLLTRLRHLVDPPVEREVMPYSKCAGRQGT